MNSTKDILFLEAEESDVYINIYPLGLYYRMEGPELCITLRGPYSSVQNYPYDPDKISLKERLREIIYDVMRSRWLYEYVDSDIFSREEFLELQEREAKERKEAAERAEKMHADRETVQLCQQAQLDPMFEGGHPENWVANCISTPRHRMHINPVTGNWGCGYCKIKGNLEELKQRLKNK